MNMIPFYSQEKFPGGTKRSIVITNECNRQSVEQIERMLREAEQYNLPGIDSLRKSLEEAFVQGTSREGG